MNGSIFTLKGTPCKKIQVAKLQPSCKFMQDAVQLCFLQVKQIEMEESISQLTFSNEPRELKNLKETYKDIFEDPVGLPPLRGVFDHRIPLLPDATPVNIRPYRCKRCLIG